MRALRTLPNFEIEFRCFLSHEFKTDEKGSRVNLATAILRDAYNCRWERAVVISGDFGLVAPIRVVIHEIKKQVEVINPQQRKASFYRHGIRAGALAASQFSPTITDANGTITKPSTW